MADELKAPRAWFTDGIPHNSALGIYALTLARGDDDDPFRGEAVFGLPYDAKLVGNPDTGVVHGGVITALLDACSGASVFAALSEMKAIATIDLRIDYLRAAEPQREILCRAHCYRVSRNVAFTRAFAYHDEKDPIAASMGTFMLGTNPGKVAR